MPPPPRAKRPSERRVAARIEVKAEYFEEAALRFRLAGFEAIHVEMKAHGNAELWFGKAVADRLWDLAAAIPEEFYAKKAIVGKVN